MEDFGFQFLEFDQIEEVLELGLNEFVLLYVEFEEITLSSCQIENFSI